MEWIMLIVLMVIFVVTLCRNRKYTENLETVSLKSKQYRRTLELAKAALDELEIPFFLSSGTCLGWARERNFMEHDYDIDLGIFERDYTPKIIHKFAEKGLKLYRIYGTIETGIELSFYAPQTGAKVDIFVHKSPQSDPQKPPQTCWFSYNIERDKKLKYCVPNFDLTEVDFLGLKINVPNPVKKYLTDHYGPDWRIPKASGPLGSYHYSTSPISLNV